MRTERKKRFSCGKCGFRPDQWKRTEEGISDFKCPRCGKHHIHFKTDTVVELIPVDTKDEELQNIFITCTGRKIRGTDTVRDFLSELKASKSCRNCGQQKNEDWKYSTAKEFDLICPSCGKKHLEDNRKLIPVGDKGGRQDVLTDGDGNNYIGEEEIDQALQELEEKQAKDEEELTTAEEFVRDQCENVDLDDEVKQ